VKTVPPLINTYMLLQYNEKAPYNLWIRTNVSLYVIFIILWECSSNRVIGLDLKNLFLV